MKTNKPVIVLSTLLTLPGSLLANDTVTNLLAEYRGQATQSFSVEAGRKLWNQTFPAADDNTRSCTNCHTNDPKQAGKHARTGKRIDPLAPSANSQRLTQTKEVRKWLHRNCKWTLGRECSAQEKGDVLTYLNSL